MSDANEKLSPRDCADQIFYHREDVQAAFDLLGDAFPYGVSVTFYPPYSRWPSLGKAKWFVEATDSAGKVSGVRADTVPDAVSFLVTKVKP